MLAKKLNFSVLLIWCSALVGCPNSDDILLGPDALFRQDIIVDIGQRRVPDANTENDSGQSNDTEIPDTTGGCTNVNDCTELAVAACEVPACIEGECIAEQKPNDAPCDDGNPCTETACIGGVCVETNAVTCPDDGNVCTAEVCNPESGCQSIPTNLECDDEEPCTVEDKCVDSVCQGEPLDCDDDNPCTETSCLEGSCVETNTIACPDDGNVCTVEVCNPELGCESVPTVLECDDGDPCTVGDSCVDSECQGGTFVCSVGTQENPGASCAAVKDADPTSPSGVYWVTLNNGTPAQVYCEMTLNGGGWVRIGLIAADIPICNYTKGFGDQTQVIGNPTITTVYPASTVAFLPEKDGDVLVSTDQGYAIFRSSSPSWNWAAIANGLINSVTLVNFGVELSVNGGPFEVLQSPGVSPPIQGPALLGGKTLGGQFSPFLGLGGTWTNTFEQNDTCVSKSENGENGLFTGGVLPSPSPVNQWNASGQIFLR